jgi:hypothetical protein
VVRGPGSWRWCGKQAAARGARAAARAAGRPALRVGPGYSGLARHESSLQARVWAVGVARGQTRHDEKQCRARPDTKFTGPCRARAGRPGWTSIVL